jgi:hypothetical protein
MAAPILRLPAIDDRAPLHDDRNRKNRMANAVQLY